MNNTIVPIYRSLHLRLNEDTSLNVVSFLDTHTRMQLLKQKYPPNRMNLLLSGLPKTVQNCKRLIACMQYMRPILNKCLDKKGELYNDIGYYLTDKPFSLQVIDEHITYYCNKMIHIIVVGLKHYTKMYKPIIVYTKNIYIPLYKRIISNYMIESFEKAIIKMYIYILSIFKEYI